MKYLVNTIAMNNENKIDMLNYWIEELTKYFNELKLDINPMPMIAFDDSPNKEDELFIKTGYYNPVDNSLVLFIDNRHIKDILRTFCHEMVHHYQYLRDPKNTTNVRTEGSIYDNKGLKDLEGEAYEKGNLLFRLYTEYKQGMVKSQQ